jgi:transposase
MSLHPQALPPIPESTVAAARAAFPHGNRYIKMRDELGVFYSDQDFASLFPARGQPAESPWRLALVVVFQFAEGLSDEQAAEAVRARIDWKYALSLEIGDSGFDASILSEFRQRLVDGNAEMRLLDGMLERLKTAGLLKARGRQRTDSTHVLAAVRGLNRLECVGETLRHALNTLAVAAPEWLQGQLRPEWTERYGTRFDDYRLPKAASARETLAAQIGADGRRLLEAIFVAEAPAWLCEIPAVCLLLQVWRQQFYAVPSDQPMCWRKRDDSPPAAQMINSPYDPNARYSVKRDTHWVGYKVHLTETCDEDTPHLITHVLSTEATTPDFHAAAVIHPALAAKDLLPAEHLLDAGYVDAGMVVSSQGEHQVRVIGPVPLDNHWQARASLGFDVACFGLDWDARVATCPQGTASTKWSETHDSHDEPIINIRFDAQACSICPARDQCTHSAHGPREITIRPRPQYEALQQARRHQKTPEFKAEYQDRAGVEGTLSQGLRIANLRRARYVGLAKTRLQHVLTAAALNLRRLGDWLTEQPRAATRIPPFVRLTQATLAQ